MQYLDSIPANKSMSNIFLDYFFIIIYNRSYIIIEKNGEEDEIFKRIYHPMCLPICR